MTTGRINQVTGLGLDHDVGANAAYVNQAFHGVAKAISATHTRRVLGGMLSHTSHASSEALDTQGCQRSKAHANVCKRSIAAHVTRSNSVRIRPLNRMYQGAAAEPMSSSGPDHPGVI